MPRFANFLQGSISSSGGSVSETLIVSPKPSCTNHVFESLELILAHIGVLVYYVKVELKSWRSTHLKKSSNADCRFHSTIFTFSSFSNPQVQRIVPSLNIHFSNKQPIRLDHDYWVTCFHWEDKVVIVQLPANPCKFKCRFNLLQDQNASSEKPFLTKKEGKL